MTCEVCGSPLKRHFYVRPKPGVQRGWYCPHCTGKRAGEQKKRACEKRRVEREMVEDLIKAHNDRISCPEEPTFIVNRRERKRNEEAAK